MRSFRNIRRSERGTAVLLAAVLAALLLAGCEPSQHSSDSGYSSDTHLPSSDSDSFSVSSEGNSPGEVSDSVGDSSGGSSTVDSAGESTSRDPAGDSSDDSPGNSSSSGNSEPSGESSGGANNSSSSGTSSVEPNNSSSSSSSTSTPVKPPDPPAQVVIPDFEVPTSPGVKVFSAANGWVDYTNASKGYISAKYTGDRARSKLRISANGETIPAYDLTVGGVVEYFPLPLGSGTYKVELFEQISGSDYSFVLQNEFEVNISNPRSPFTYSNRYVNYNADSKCVYKAAELCAGKTDNISKIAAIFGWITSNISYDNVLAANAPKTYYPDPDRTMQKKTGICYDYASLMAAMLRSQGIPTRLVVGYAGSTKHAWNEIYTEQTGWITPELFLGNNGYNTTDATFYSGAADKKQIAAYISNPANYSSMYYY